MRFVSHRGNLNGRNVNRENTLSYIEQALDQNYDVEIDIRRIDGKLFLGHDNPQEEIDLKFLMDHRLWIHAKNPDALTFLLGHPVCVFWHDKDAYTLTSWGDVWTYPGSEPTEWSTYVLPERLHSGLELKDDSVVAHLLKSSIGKSCGVCSDYVGILRKYWE